MEPFFSFYVGLGTYLALCATIYKVCEKGDTLVTDDTKLAIAVWILDLKPGKTVQNWPSTFTHWFDKIFGEKHWSGECFFRSCIASFWSAILVLLIWVTLRPDEFNAVWKTDTFFGFMIPFLFFVFFLNFIPDYISLLETRYILGKMRKTSSGLKQASLLILDVVLTILIASTIPLTLYIYARSNFTIQKYFSEVLPLTGDSIILQSTGTPFLSICFYTSFFTSIWVWSYALSGIMLRFLTFWEYLKTRVKLEEKPLSAIGAVIIVFITTFTSISIALTSFSSPSHSIYSNLRSTPLDLNGEQVKEMMLIKNYFGKIGNIRGSGFENNFKPTDEIVYDRATNLYWQRGGSQAIKYENAQNYIRSLNEARLGDYDNWRLPTLEEAMSLMEPDKNSEGLYIDHIFDRQQITIWTADRFDTLAPWFIDFGYGGCSPVDIRKGDRGSFIRAVRSSQKK